MVFHLAHCHFEYIGSNFSKCMQFLELLLVIAPTHLQFVNIRYATVLITSAARSHTKSLVPLLGSAKPNLNNMLLY